MSLKRLYWSHFTKAIEGLVRLLVFNVLVIRYIYYVSQKLRRILYGIVPILIIF